MRISRGGSYALRMMVDIARHQDVGRVVSLGDIARRTGISRRYLEQLAGALRRFALVEGVSGKGGGYRLARPAAEIAVRQVLEAACGPLELVRCVGRPEGCGLSPHCECRWLFARLSRSLAEILESTSLQQLASHNWPQPQQSEAARRIAAKC